MLSAEQLEKRRQVAGVFTVLGLVVEALCLIWSTPIAFVIFVAIGGFFMSVGIVLYLYSLIPDLKAPV
jgi:predicted membrane channel-forming protein YqfA (hemolysin III family)